MWSELVGWNKIWPPNDEYFTFHYPVPFYGLFEKSFVFLPNAITRLSKKLDISIVLPSAISSGYKDGISDVNLGTLPSNGVSTGTLRGLLSGRT